MEKIYFLYLHTFSLGIYTYEGRILLHSFLLGESLMETGYCKGSSVFRDSPSLGIQNVYWLQGIFSTFHLSKNITTTR